MMAPSEGDIVISPISFSSMSNIPTLSNTNGTTNSGQLPWSIQILSTNMQSALPLAGWCSLKQMIETQGLVEAISRRSANITALETNCS